MLQEFLLYSDMLRIIDIDYRLFKASSIAASFDKCYWTLSKNDGDMTTTF